MDLMHRRWTYMACCLILILLGAMYFVIFQKLEVHVVGHVYTSDDSGSTHTYSPGNNDPFTSPPQALRPHPDNKNVASDWLLLNPVEHRKYVLETCAVEVRRWDAWNETSFCECVPRGLLGMRGRKIRDGKAPISWEKVNNSFPLDGFRNGGRWSPRGCVARRRVAIIIPFRDRESHLRAFLVNNVPIWQRQKIEFRIFVVEQEEPAKFNKGSVMNAGFIEIRKIYKFDCVIFHDVDLLLMNDNNIAFCADRVLHYGAFVSTLNYRLKYFSQFGGALAMTPAQYEQMNGYSTIFGGWGGEDDDFFNRVRTGGFGWVRPDNSIARYHMIKHNRDKLNPENSNATVAFKPKNQSNYQTEGLNTVVYRVKAVEKLIFCTRITLDVAGADGVFLAGPEAYDVISGTCDQHKGDSDFAYSLVSCKYICDADIHCAGFEYSESERSCSPKVTLCSEPTPNPDRKVYYKRPD